MPSIVFCNALPETNELVSPKAGTASGWAGAAGATTDGAEGGSATGAVGTTGAAAGTTGGSAGAGLLVVAAVLVDAAGGALGYSTSTISTLLWNPQNKILILLKPSTPKSPSP